MNFLPNTAFIHWDDKMGPKRTPASLCAPSLMKSLLQTVKKIFSSKYMIVDDKGMIVWYTKKKLAENHGAAARRYETCYVYHKHCTTLDPKAESQCKFGLDLPYQLGQGPPVLVPPEVEETIEAEVQPWKRRAEMLAEKEWTRKLAHEHEVVDEKEAMQVRQSYREQRMVNLEVLEAIESEDQE